MVNKLRLSFSSTKELNHIINNVLPGHPAFQHCEVVIGGETLEFYHRNIISCIRSIYGNPKCTQDLVVAPEWHYTDQGRSEHIYSEMHTGDWWWAVQVRTILDVEYTVLTLGCFKQTSLKTHSLGATVVLLIISSNKTQLTHFGNKTAYPVYLTIGNILKNICCKPSRHAQVLLGYIPTTKLKGLANQAGQCCAIANLYHGCMQAILDPISAVGETGIAMMSGDGIWQWCHPIFALFVGDYPEQVLVTCTYNS